MEDITNAVLRVLTSSCADCGITSDIIDMQSFRCFPDSPSHVTYRARLQGTSEIDSGLPISLIEDWVRGGADIVVTGLLMNRNVQYESHPSVRESVLTLQLSLMAIPSVLEPLLVE